MTETTRDNLTAQVTIEKRKRRSKPRHRDEVLASMEERIKCIPVIDCTEDHITRMKELLDELRRSLGGREESEES